MKKLILFLLLSHVVTLAPEAQGQSIVDQHEQVVLEDDQEGGPNELSAPLPFLSPGHYIERCLAMAEADPDPEVDALCLALAVLATVLL